MVDNLNMNAASGWNRVLAPFYSAEGLESRGIAITEDLIDLHAGDDVVFPHAQFDVNGDRLHRREDVIRLWNELIRPAIHEGYVDEWTATALLLQETDEHPSRASEIAADPSKVDAVAVMIQQTLSHWRQ